MLQRVLLVTSKYVHFFACFLKAILWTWNSKCYYHSPLFTSYPSMAAIGLVHVVFFLVANTASGPQWVCSKLW